MFFLAINRSRYKLGVIARRYYPTRDFLLADIGEGIAEVQIINW